MKSPERGIEMRGTTPGSTRVRWIARGRAWGTVASATVLALFVTPLPGSAQDSVSREAVTAAVRAARGGGTVLLCRHAATGSFREREPVDYGDPSTQRRLSERGRRQSEAVGRALGRLGVELGEVVASPMARALRTAELLAGDEGAVVVDSIWHTNDGDYGGAHRDRRAEVLAAPVPRGNRLIVSHITTMKSVLPDEVGPIREGDCAVVRPAAAPPGVGAADGSGSYTLLGVVPWEAWGRRAAADSG